MVTPKWAILAFVAFTFLQPVPSISADNHRLASAGPARQLPFRPGEKLTYEISWSNIIQAGTAVMEVQDERRPDGRPAYHFISTASSGHLLSKFYKVSDRVDSFIDSDGLYSLSFHLDQHHGKRTKQRDMMFDHAKGMVVVSADGFQQKYAVPDNIQDALSVLYYVRANDDFAVGKSMFVNVHQDGKTWTVEVQTIGRERIKTPFGELNTIKIKSYPRYDGVFQNNGEIFIWLTDDARKVPVLMKSTISIGTIVATLVDLRYGEENHEFANSIKTSFQNH